MKQIIKEEGNMIEGKEQEKDNVDAIKTAKREKEIFRKKIP